MNTLKIKTILTVAALAFAGQLFAADAANDPAQEQKFLPEKNGVLREVWEKIDGAKVENLTKSAKYKEIADRVKIVESVELNSGASSYGARFTALITVPETGKYTFYAAADDCGELWLSSDDTSKNLKLIASVSRWTHRNQFKNHASQKSKEIRLEKGRKYLIRGLQKQSSGGGHFSAGWSGPKLKLGVIKGKYLTVPKLNEVQIAKIKETEFKEGEAARVLKENAKIVSLFDHADQEWLKKSPKSAIPIYKTILETLPERYKMQMLRSLIIMRIAKAQLASRDNDACLKTLALLDKMDYVPEHHALAAKEMKVVISGKPNPGLQRTPIPTIGKVRSTIYVSASAGPGGAGSKAKPFSSIESAIKRARQLRKSPGNGSIEIVLASGRYLIKETMKLTKDDSGTAESPLIIRSEHPDNPAELTGGTVLKNWEKVTDKSILERLPDGVKEKVLVCDLKAHGIKDMGELVFGGFQSSRASLTPRSDHRFKTFPVPELFLNNNVQMMARWPNEKETTFFLNRVPEKKEARSEQWAKEKDLWIHGYIAWSWADVYEKVADIEANGKINLAPPINISGVKMIDGPHSLGHVINALCEIDLPGEWHLDSKNGRIYFLPPEGFDPKTCIISSFNTPLVADNCSFLQLRDLKLNFIRGDALSMTNCSDLLISGVDIQNCSGLGIKIMGGVRHMLHSCRINSTGRGAIDLLCGDWQKLIPANSIVENCHLSNLSRIDRTYTPALLLEGMGIKVRHNSFTDIPSSAIRLEACDALIELNYFFNCVYESGDQGAIDMWANPLYRGNIIRWNDFDRIINESSHMGAAAVRFDDAICGFMISENVFRKGSHKGFGAVQNNRGTDNYTEGNIFIDWHSAFSWSGGILVGEEWGSYIRGHSRSRQMLKETDWQSKAWKSKYPMVKDLMNGDDNLCYLIGNQIFAPSRLGGHKHAFSFANKIEKKKVNADSLESIKPLLLPWNLIPLDKIGSYSGR